MFENKIHEIIDTTLNKKDKVLKIELYKSDARDCIRHWTIEALYDEECIEIKYGTHQGLMQTQTEQVEINQSNRDIVEQIDLYTLSRAQNKRYQGYKDTIEQALKFKGTNYSGLPRPMLAQKIKEKSKVNWVESFVQRKYDGHRCIVYNEDGKLFAYSRNGKPVKSIHHILKGLTIPEGVFLDGELYSHGTMLQTINSLVKKPQKESEELLYVVYDLIDEAAYCDRYEKILSMQKSGFFGDHAIIAETFKGVNRQNAMLLFARFRAEGYEGAMIRHGSSGYASGARSQSLLKIKSEEDDIFKVVEITQSADGWAILKCETKEKKHFTVSAPGNMEKKTETLINSEFYINKMLHVKYAFITKDGIPFHPIATTWKDDE